jgi:alpha-L-fucosidase
MKKLFSPTTGAMAALLFLALTALPCSAQTHYEPKWESLDKRPCPEWYQDAKFGIFIHWGLYSVPAWGVTNEYAEWYWKRMADKKPDNPWWQHHVRVWGENFDYAQFAPLFKCEYFNPDQWADLLARSGAKYIVPTSKHHEGFCLWPSAQADATWGRPWNAVSTGPKRDLLGELGDACRKRGLKYGFYYSLYEWFNPLWQKDPKRYAVEHMIPQFKDVVTRYHPSIIFSDGEWDLPSQDWKSEELLAWLFNESPCRDEVVVNDRWGKETRHKHGSYFTTEYGAGLKDASHPWEENRGMGHSFGWSRVESIDDYKSARELIFILVDLVSRGGNLLLDIGPTGDGRIPVIMQERLVEVGQWLKVNGEAIYGTRSAARECQWSVGQRPGQEYGRYKIKYNVMEQVGQQPKGDRAVKQLFFTQKPGALYAISPGWPGSKLVIRDLKAPATAEVVLLGYPGKLNCSWRQNTLEVQLPNLSSDQLPCLHAYAFKIPGGELLADSGRAN